MGTIINDMLVVSIDTCSITVPEVAAAVARFEDWRQTLPEDMAGLVLGPSETLINGVTSWVLMPDGSKMGWHIRHTGDALREKFLACFASPGPGFWPVSVVHSRWGDLDGGPTITSTYLGDT